ncbi:hypothetical protein BS78_K261000 [Paspalum vaginatum]|uniref:RBR-type E3 ubiquitin transferase n=1 Tax=Paspalum vaginatum TaxID=158149 RepID=A0A9W7XE98_9POAL|nr:hypothetical protein BS78_K261000 [Paspalum vaginatum]
MTSAGCSHFYCGDCWRGYIRAAVGNGMRCLSLQCPDPSCSAAVVRELVDAAAGDEDRARYARFALRSYVEDSGGGIRWCPGPGCTRAVEFLACGGDGDPTTTDVFCDCRHGFCWRCGEEAHQPVSCDTTTNWILTNTKNCPSCRRPIEKNQGCNHMTCTAPCRHHFCWLCLDPWDDHKGCLRYDYRQQQQVDGKQLAGGQGKTARKEETRRRQAKASLGRYLYHYERWEANRKSLHKALADMDQLERSELERMARAVDVPATELGFVTEAYNQIADGRRVLRWAHAYGYFLDPSNEAKRCLFDDLQSQANRWLECLHGCAELERKELFFGADNGESAVAAETFRAYREKVANLTGVTRKFLGNLVKAFETDLPEVAKPRFVQTVNAPTMGRQTVGVGGIIYSTATVTVEPAAIPPPMVSNVALQGIPTLQTSLSSLSSQEANIANDRVQEHRPITNLVEQPIDLLSMWHNIGTPMGLPNILLSSGASTMSGPGQPIAQLLAPAQTTLVLYGAIQMLLHHPLSPTAWARMCQLGSIRMPNSRHQTMSKFGR